MHISIKLLQTLIYSASFTLRIDDRQTIAVPQCLLVYDIRKLLAALTLLRSNNTGTLELLFVTTSIIDKIRIA